MRYLCLCCSTVSEITEKVPGCPGCGCNRHVPADADDTVTLSLTKHELRILTFFASNWARRSADDDHIAAGVQGILDRLGPQTDAALSLSQELADVRAAFPDSDVTVYDASGRRTDL